MTAKVLQAKHISDADFLRAVDVHKMAGTNWASQWDIAAALGVPSKIVLAKARSLIKRGLMRGCACGCRGDFERGTS